MPVSEAKRREMIEYYMQRQQLLVVLNAITNEIINGVPESVACRKHNIDQMKFRNFIRGDWTPKQKEEFKDTFISWEERFVSAITSEPVITDNFYNAYNIAISRLTEREATIINGRYPEGKTLDEIGKELGLSKNTVMQYRDRALIKISRSWVRNLFKLTKAESDLYIQKLSEDKEIDRLLEEVKKGKKKILKLKNCLKELDSCNTLVLEEIQKTERGANLLLLGTRADTDIDEMELSQRAYNCLKRANINTLKDLLDRGLPRVQRIRGMGDSTIEEIKEKVAELGFPEWSEE